MNIFPLQYGDDILGLISTAFKSSTTFTTNISLFYLKSDDETKENATETWWYQEEFQHPEENGRGQTENKAGIIIKGIPFSKSNLPSKRKKKEWK